MLLFLCPVKLIFCSLSSSGSPMMVTVDGGVFEALLSNMIPGKMYQVTVSSVKGLEESDPSTDTVTTGQLSPSLYTTLTSSVSVLLWSQFVETLIEAIPPDSVFLFVPISFGQTSGSDCSQCHGLIRPVAVATVCGHCRWLRHYIQRRFR